jgi:hypothetical protein
LGQLRDGKLSASPDMVSQILAALDRIKAILAGLSQSGAEPVGDDSALIEALNATASGKPPVHMESPAPIAAAPVEAPTPAPMTAAAPPVVEAVTPPPSAPAPVADVMQDKWLYRAASAVVAHHLGTAGRRDEDPDAAGRQRLEQIAPVGKGPGA